MSSHFKPLEMSSLVAQMMRTVYGERPITELLALLADDADLMSLLQSIERTDGKPMQVIEDDHFDALYAEAPLGDPVGTVDLVICRKWLCVLIEVKQGSYKLKDTKDRLDDQIPKYAAVLRPTSKSSKKPLAREIHTRLEKSGVMLVVATDDNQFPEGLRDLLSIEGQKQGRATGWMPYSAFEKALHRYGIDVDGQSPHIWARTPRLGRTDTQT